MDKREEINLLLSGYSLAKEMGYANNEYWKSIKRSIDRLKGEIMAKKRKGGGKPKC